MAAPGEAGDHAGAGLPSILRLSIESPGERARTLAQATALAARRRRILRQDPHARAGLLAAIELASRRRRVLLGSMIERRPDGQRDFRLAGLLREIDQHLGELLALVEGLGG